MKSRKKVQTAKAAGESFSAAAGATSLLFDLISGFLKVPSAVKWIISGLIGLIAGCISGRNAYKAEEEKELLQEERRQQRLQLVADVKLELQDIRKHLEERQEPHVVHQRVNQAVVRLEKMHRLAANDRFFKAVPEDQKVKLLKQKDRSDDDKTIEMSFARPASP